MSKDAFTSSFGLSILFASLLRVPASHQRKDVVRSCRRTFVPLSYLKHLVGLSTLCSLEVRSPHMNGRVVVRSCGRLLCTSCVRFSCGGGVSFSYVVTLAAWTICWLVASPFGLSAGTSYDSLLPVQWSVWHRPSIFRIGHCVLVTWVRFRLVSFAIHPLFIIKFVTNTFSTKCFFKI